MSGNCFIDTNILVYAFDKSESQKQAIAQQILKEKGNWGKIVLSTQVLQEFFVVVTKKLTQPLPKEIAYQVVQSLAEYPLVEINAPIILKAIHRHQTDNFSFWDALIVEAALNAGCYVLLSEDMQENRRIDSLIIQNPFSQ